MVSAPSFLDQPLQIVGAFGHELGFGQRQVIAAEIIGRGRVDHLRQRQVELAVKQLQPGQRAGHQPRPVIATPARDDLFLLRQAADVVVIPDQLDVCFIRIRPRQPEIDPRHAFGRAVHHHFRQGDRRFRPLACISVVIGQLARLRGDRLGDFGAAIARVDAVQPRKPVQQAVAVAVGDVDALAPGDDALRRLAARELAEIGRGMEKILAVPFAQFVVGQHAVPPSSAQSRQTYLMSVNAFSPWREPSRARPDCLTPPNGIGAPVTLVRLTATMPNCNARDMR